MLLENCREAGVEVTVVASSDKAYGPHDELPYTEDSALQPIYPYDVSKAATDLIARSYWHTHGLPVAVTRRRSQFLPPDPRDCECRARRAPTGDSLRWLA